MAKLYKRSFLNDKEGTAFCEIDAEQTSNSWLDAHLKVADCNRVVSLDFYADSNKALRARIKKIDRIISMATALRDFLKTVDLKPSQEDFF